MARYNCEYHAYASCVTRMERGAWKWSGSVKNFQRRYFRYT